MTFHHYFALQPGGHSSSGSYQYESIRPRLRSRDTEAPYECMLVQIHALYPKGHSNDGHTVDDENEGWRCVDTATDSVLSLSGLPAGFVKNTNLTASDSSSSFLSISAARTIKDDGEEQEEMLETLFQHANSRMNDAVATDEDKEKNRIEISPGASVSISRGSTSSDGRRRLVGAGDSTGKHILLVVRVTDRTGDAPSKRASELSSDIFSDSNNLVSV